MSIKTVPQQRTFMVMAQALKAKQLAEKRERARKSDADAHRNLWNARLITAALVLCVPFAVLWVIS